MAPRNDGTFVQRHVQAPLAIDDLLNKSRRTVDAAQRVKVYEQIASEFVKTRPIVYLYHRHWLWAYNKKLTGVRTIPDGLIRVQGLKM